MIFFCHVFENIKAYTDCRLAVSIQITCINPPQRYNLRLTCGIRQDYVLSPYLFAMYIDDLIIF